MTNTTDTPGNISDSERMELLKLVGQTRRRFLKGASVEPKKEVSPEEYVERLKSSLKKDRTLLSTVRQDSATKGMKLWAEQVNATFAKATTDMPQILDRVRRLETKSGLHKTSVVLFGDQMGRGKTWQAYGYLNSIINHGIATPGQIIHGTEGSIMSSISNSGYERSERTRDLLRPSHRFFFIDDVGQGFFFKEQNRHEIWYALIDHIYSRQLTLILTTNLSFDERGLGQHVGPRAFDRLKSLVGDDGALRITGVNRREQVYRQNEEQYRSGGKK